MMYLAWVEVQTCAPNQSLYSQVSVSRQDDCALNPPTPPHFVMFSMYVLPWTVGPRCNKDRRFFTLLHGVYRLGE